MLVPAVEPPSAAAEVFKAGKCRPAVSVNQPQTANAGRGAENPLQL